MHKNKVIPENFVVVSNYVKFPSMNVAYAQSKPSLLSAVVSCRDVYKGEFFKVKAQQRNF